MTSRIARRAHLNRTAAALAACARALAAVGPALGQPARSCDAASFARLELPATRIVSADVVRDDARALAHCCE